MKKVITENLVKATVVKISWERIFVTLEVAVEGECDDLTFYVVSEQGTANARFKQKILDNGHYSLTLNITNQGENQCVAYGDYWIVACREGRAIGVCETGLGLVPELDDCSRGFLYGGRKKVFSVTFYISEGEESLPFRMLVLPAAKTDFGAPSQKTVKWHHTPLKRRIDKKRRPFLRDVYRHYSRRYKNKTNTILFLSEQSDYLGGNQRAVIRRMKERGMEEAFEIIESARAAASEHQSVKSWLEVIRKLARSSIVVVDDHAPVLDWLILDERTKVIQLWHAGAGFKSSGYSRWGHEGCPAPYSAHRQYDYGIAGSKNIAPFFSEVWGINDEQVLATGMPRMDEYLDEGYRSAKTDELYEQFPACKGKKVILFAPTYRGRGKRTAYYPYELIDFEKLYQLCGEEYIVMFKMHPWVLKPVPISEKYRDKFIDVNKYPNINDLFYITELLITDYSSNIFEYSLMKKPMLFFAFDKIQYSFSRGFHRAYEESAPGKVCYTFEELLKAIADRDFETEKVQHYLEHHFDHIDTHSSDRVIDWLILGELPEAVREELKKVERANEQMRSISLEIYDEDLVVEQEEQEE